MRISKGDVAFGNSFEYDNDVQSGVTRVANGATIRFLGVGPTS
jgi:hypothetical protein